MKKIIPIFAVIFLCAVCDPPHYDSKGAWYVRNCTAQSIKLEIAGKIENPYFDQLIAPGDSIQIFHMGFVHRKNEVPFFDAIHLQSLWSERAEQSWNNVNEQDRYIKILSEEDVLLRTWKYPEKDQPGKQFFNESAWKYNINLNENDYYAIATWVFEVQPEDIVPEQEP